MDNRLSMRQDIESKQFANIVEKNPGKINLTVIIRKYRRGGLSGDTIFV